MINGYCLCIIVWLVAVNATLPAILTSLYGVGSKEIVTIWSFVSEYGVLAMTLKALCTSFLSLKHLLLGHSATGCTIF